MPDATPNTIPEILRQTAARYPDRLALRQPSKSGAHTWTWSEYLQAAEEIAAGLHALGIARGDHVAISGAAQLKDGGRPGGSAVSVLADQQLVVGVIDGAVHDSRVKPDLHFALLA